MKTKLLIIALTIIPLIDHAQVHIGVTTAVNSTFVLDKGLSQDPRYNSQMTFNFAPVGISFGADLGDSFGLQLESIFANQGQIFEIVDIAQNVVGQRKIDMSYIQLPLFFKFMNGTDKKARPNFSLGPQLSILQSGVETMQYDASVQQINNLSEVPEGAIDNNDGTYQVPALPATEIMSSTALEDLRKFKDMQLEIAASFGFDFDIGQYLFLTTVIRANYSFTDMRNGDLIELIKTNNLDGLVSKRANLAIGAQIGINFMFGGVRSFNAKEAVKAIGAF